MNVWVPIICALLSAWYGYVSWYKRRRSVLIEASRTAAIAALERAGDARDEPLMAALLARDPDAVSQWLSSYSGAQTLAMTEARRYADAERATIAYFEHHFFWTTAVSGTLVIILVHTIGAAVTEVKSEHAAARAYDMQLRMIGLANVVSHLDSAFGHTVVLVVYRPDAMTEAKVRSLGAVAQKVEFYPVACCVSFDSAAHFFQRTKLPYPQRLMGGHGNRATMSALQAVGAGVAPASDGFVSVMDSGGVMIAHWNVLPDSAELRATLQ